MRVNIYSQELTSETKMIVKVADTGVPYSGVMLMLHSSEKLHNTPKDDDRSAITFWLPKSPLRRDELAETFERMAAMVRAAPPEFGT